MIEKRILEVRSYLYFIEIIKVQNAILFSAAILKKNQFSFFRHKSVWKEQVCEGANKSYKENQIYTLRISVLFFVRIQAQYRKNVKNVNFSSTNHKS
jgi:hypothetical protein